MLYYVAQILGVLITIGSVIGMQLKNKKHIILCSATINVLSALNILFLDQFGSGVLINLLAVLQVILSLYHDHKGTEPSKWEKIGFLVIYVACGIIGFRQGLDILPIIAVVFYMFAIFQKDEQKLRLFMLGNATAWAIYHGVIGSTAVAGQIANGCSALIGLFRYSKIRKQKTEKNTEIQ